jgi:ABC-type nickel/cobalt efflux system permease component RcnA
MELNFIGGPFHHRVVRRIAFAGLAVGVMVLCVSVLASIILHAQATPQAVKNPFGLTLREVAPSAAGLSALVIQLQTQFYRALALAVEAVKESGTAIPSLATVGFLYGIFHAAGPGHGKGVISAYILATNRSLARGLGLSVSAALLQGSVAVAIVTTLTGVLHATALSINATARAIEIVSFAGIAAAGLLLVWWKAGEFDTLLTGAPEQPGSSAKSEQRVASPRSWREYAAIVAAAGLRPCTGALLLLVFAESQNIYWAGVIGAYAMAVGTAITTGSLAALSVAAKGLLDRAAGRLGAAGARALAGFELAAAAFVFVLGAVFLTGVWGSALPMMID